MAMSDENVHEALETMHEILHRVIEAKAAQPTPPLDIYKIGDVIGFQVDMLDQKVSRVAIKRSADVWHTSGDRHSGSWKRTTFSVVGPISYLGRYLP